MHLVNWNVQYYDPFEHESSVVIVGLYNVNNKTEPLWHFKALFPLQSGYNQNDYGFTFTASLPNKTEVELPGNILRILILYLTNSISSWSLCRQDDTRVRLDVRLE